MAVDGNKIVGTSGMSFVENHHILAVQVEKWAVENDVILVYEIMEKCL